MNYHALACELMNIRANLLRVPVNQDISKMMKGELFALNYLHTHEKIVHPKELSEQMSVSTARIASLLNHMEEKNLILREPDSEDNRQIIVRLTEKGKQTIHDVRDEVIAHVAAMLEGLGSEDAEAYVRIHEKIWRNYQSGNS